MRMIGIGLGNGLGTIRNDLANSHRNGVGIGNGKGIGNAIRK